MPASWRPLALPSRVGCRPAALDSPGSQAQIETHRLKPWSQAPVAESLIVLPPVMEGDMPDRPTISCVRRCSTCGEPSHVRVMVPSADKPGFDEYLYECQSCGYAETIYFRRDG